MRVFRLQKQKYGSDFSGKGSNTFSGRWNIKGSDLLILYTTSNRSLALLEKIDSFTTEKGVLPPKFIMLELEIPDHDVLYIEEKSLPNGWNNDIDKYSSQAFGMAWLKSLETLAISVPSVISMDRNVLINPQHPRVNQVKLVGSIKGFPIDKRLMKKKE